MTSTDEGIQFVATGLVANERLSPLLPTNWNDVSESVLDRAPDFIWENAPRRETKDFRDSTRVYSHLPNGTNLMDSKWVLGRLFANSSSENDQHLACLETHCFRGLDGFESFSNKVSLQNHPQESAVEKNATYPDIVDRNMDFSTAPSPSVNSPNLWVVKDAMANGAGGIWVVGPENAAQFANQATSPLYPEHKYVAQKRKCHVRVYSLMTSDGRAFVHKRAFLHVANDKFTTNDAESNGLFQDSIHITNCCANSHDGSKFAGEILADLEAMEYSERDGQSVVPLAMFAPSIYASISMFAKRAFPFLQGGQANHGFEYMGVDFMLSYNEQRQPVAYLLEVNAPPSQDTATGLDHAENLHNDVIRDLVTMWVLPHVLEGEPSRAGGWRCVYTDEETAASASEKEAQIIPSKAAIINRIRWNLFEKKAQKAESANGECSQPTIPTSNQGTQTLSLRDDDPNKAIATFARSQFPYYSQSLFERQQVFFENAGGSQVPAQVVDAMSKSLTCRNRSLHGSKSKEGARNSIRTLLGGSREDHIFLGPNASTLLANLARAYVQSGLVKEGDEVVISTENHNANFLPWIQAAKDVGAIIKLYSPFEANKVSGKHESFQQLEALVSPKTRIVAVPHASNILGQIRDMSRVTEVVKQRSQCYAHVIVDGVAAVPHHFADFAHLGVDWYVISCHKVFGPHIGGLCGKERAVQELQTAPRLPAEAKLASWLECGTLNYEGCAGVIGLLHYFSALARTKADKTVCPTPQQSLSAGEDCAESTSSFRNRMPHFEAELCDTGLHIKKAYETIRKAEEPLVQRLMDGLGSSNNVRILQVNTHELQCLVRLPTVSFVHQSVSPQTIVKTCEENNIDCRCSSFLCPTNFAESFAFDMETGVARVSLVHYNTCAEVNELLNVLKSIPGW
eukprot:Nitzschia sp. Nitz4//scaffold76_size158648//155766//158525//NITZ4_002574-RA/size158648-snap-gene-0.318-mRNA-1//-1//CDS//3329557929//926//frame0